MCNQEFGLVVVALVVVVYLVDEVVFLLGDVKDKEDFLWRSSLLLIVC